MITRSQSTKNIKEASGGSEHGRGMVTRSKAAPARFVDGGDPRKNIDKLETGTGTGAGNKNSEKCDLLGQVGLMAASGAHTILSWVDISLHKPRNPRLHATIEHSALIKASIVGCAATSHTKYRLFIGSRHLISLDSDDGGGVALPCPSNQLMVNGRRVKSSHLPRPQPHQRDLCAYLCDNSRNPQTEKYPFWVMWAMGAGKTLAMLYVLAKSPPGSRMLVVCNHTLVQQWTKVCSGYKLPPGTVVECLAWQELRWIITNSTSASLAAYLRGRLVVVDEAHYFRNITVHMEAMITTLRMSPRLIYLSGTPLMNNTSDLAGFAGLMVKRRSGVAKYAAAARGQQALPKHLQNAHTLTRLFKGRIAAFDPSCDRILGLHFPRVEEEVVRCRMSLAQFLMYCANRSSSFDLRVGNRAYGVYRGGIFNRYNSELRNACLLPFAGHPDRSPKLIIVAANLHRVYTAFCVNVPRNESTTTTTAICRQIVYCSRLETGLYGLQTLLTTTHASGSVAAPVVLLLDGTTTAEQRTQIITVFNAPTSKDGRHIILLLSCIGSDGLDLSPDTTALHIVEPQENLFETKQIINRVVRYSRNKEAHKHTICVYHYLAVVPPLSTMPARSGGVADAHLESAIMDVFGERQGRSLIRQERQGTEGKPSLLVKALHSVFQNNDKVNYPKTIDEKMYADNCKKAELLHVYIQALKDASISAPRERGKKHRANMYSVRAAFI